VGQVGQEGVVQPSADSLPPYVGEHRELDGLEVAADPVLEQGSELVQDEVGPELTPLAGVAQLKPTRRSSS